MKLGFLFGHKLAPDAAKRIAEVLLNGKWTQAELDFAAKYIPTDAEMCETITYNRTVNPTVFAKARSKPSVMRGRLFGHQEAVNYSGQQNETMSKLFETALYGEKTVFFLR